MAEEERFRSAEVQNQKGNSREGGGPGTRLGVLSGKEAEEAKKAQKEQLEAEEKLRAEREAQDEALRKADEKPKAKEPQQEELAFENPDVDESESSEEES